MLKRTDLEGGATLFEGPKGIVYVHSRPAGIMEGKWSGEFDESYYAPISAELDRRTTGATGLHLFTDLAEMRGYTPEFRNHWVKWFRDIRPRVASNVFLQKSALVRIGLTIVSIAMGGHLQALTDAAAYAEATRKAGLPPIPPLSIPARTAAR